MERLEALRLEEERLRLAEIQRLEELRLKKEAEDAKKAEGERIRLKAEEDARIAEEERLRIEREKRYSKDLYSTFINIITEVVDSSELPKPGDKPKKSEA